MRGLNEVMYIIIRQRICIELMLDKWSMMLPIKYDATLVSEVDG